MGVGGWGESTQFYYPHFFQRRKHRSRENLTHFRPWPCPFQGSFLAPWCRLGWNSQTHAKGLAFSQPPLTTLLSQIIGQKGPSSLEPFPS